MAQQTFEEIVAAVKQAESRGKRYKDDGKTLTTSPKGALGEMQVMPKTILDPGFGVAPAKDKSPDEIARVGRDYLQAMIGKYGDTEKALVAYNMGPGATDKWLASGAKPEKLPEETRTYVQRVKGFLGKDVPRETSVAKKEREPLPPSLPPMAEAQPTPAKATVMAKMDVKSMPASYQAAFALAALADAQDEEDDRVFNENKSTETEEFFANYKPVNKLASLDLSVTPVMMKDGGDVAEAKETARKGEAYQELEKYLESRGEMPSVKIGGYMPGGTNGIFTSDNLNIGSGTIRINKDTAKALIPSVLAHEITHAADRQLRQQAIEQGMFGNSNQFTEAYEKMVGPEGRNRTQLLRKRYPEFELDNRYYRSEPKEVAAHGIGAYAGPNIQDRAPRHVDATAATEFRILMDLAQRNVDKGPTGLAKIPAFFRKFGRYADGGEVYRADGSPPTGERKLDPETIRILRNEGTSPASLKRVDPPLELNPSAAGLPGLMMYNDPSLTRTTTSGYILDGSDDKKNVGMAQAMFLNPSKGERADTVAHETEHLLARQNLGSGANVNSKFDELIGDKGNSRLKFVRKAVELGPYLEEKYNIKNAYFDPKMLEFQSKFGMGKNLLYEQLASLSAAEQRLKVDLTKDPELRKTLFARPDVRETYNALTGLRQTRLDPRDLPPHTRVPEPGMLDAIKGVFKRADGGMVYRADGSPEEGERLTPQQMERIAAQESAEREAASNAAFIAQKSGIGRKAGPVSQALQSGQGQIEFLKGMTNVPQNILGAPMDISNMIANVYGGGVEKPFMGSEYLKEKSRAAGLGFTPSTDPTLAGFYGAGDLGSNLVNPAGVTRTGVKAAEKTGEAAKMLARDFQGYNQQLAAPGASYAVRNKGTPFIMTPERTTVSRQVVPEMNEADAYADKLARFVDTGAGRRTDNPALANWFRSKVGAYLRRDFGTEQDQMVQAADKGLKMHFMSPRFLEDRPYALSRNIGMDREREGFPKAGFAKTAKGQEAEAIIDSSIYPVQLQDVPEKYVPPNMKQFMGTNPEMRLSEMGTSVDENLKLEKLADEMDKMFNETVFKAYGEQVPMPKDYVLTEKTLEGLTPAQASNRVALKQEWAAKKQAEFAGVAISKDPKIVSHSYDNGNKWISPADLADNAKHEEMVKDIGCAGGWCTDKSTYALDAGSGDNRLNILLDKKFEPRVQITLNNPTPSMKDFALYMSEMGDNSVATKLQTANYGWNTVGGRNSVGVDALVETELKAMPEYLDFIKQNQNTKNITEIKGQFNTVDLRKSPYLKEVQDFVKRQGPELQTVDNLDGINMVDMRDKMPNLSQYGKELLSRMVKLNGNSYFAGKDEFSNLIKKASEMPNNAARQIQMNMFQPPAEKAYGGMIERQLNDNRRYL